MMQRIVNANALGEEPYRIQKDLLYDRGVIGRHVEEGRPYSHASRVYPANLDSNRNYDYEYRDGSMLETALGGLFCFFLFLLVIFCIAYPLTMYKDTPQNILYSDDKWWCYHCLQSNCAGRCWYGA
jgi:hypothetical protein